MVFSLLLLTGLQTAQAVSPDDLLPPQQAFQISADGSEKNKIRVKWRIADGYYLYQSKIRFSTESDNITLTSPDFPEAEIKDDEFFGRIGIYRDEAIIDIPILMDKDTPDIITLHAKSQGCADIGVCFPPQTQTVLVAMSNNADGPAPVDPNSVEDPTASGSGPDTESEEPAEAPIIPKTDPLLALTAFNDELGFDDEDDGILPPEKAYLLSQLIDGQGNLQLGWQIAEGTYLYHDKIELSLTGDEGLQLGKYKLPKPKTKQDGVRPDGSIGDVQIYQGNIELNVPLKNTATQPGSTTLTVKYLSLIHI